MGAGFGPATCGVTGRGVCTGPRHAVCGCVCTRRGHVTDVGEGDMYIVRGILAGSGC